MKSFIVGLIRITILIIMMPVSFLLIIIDIIKEIGGDDFSDLNGRFHSFIMRD